MKLIEIDWRPTDRRLRQFGATCFVALPGVGWIWGGGTATVLLLASIGLVLALAGMAAPTILKPIFLALTLVTAPIGMVVGEFALLLVYFGVFLPFGLVFRIVRRDGLQLRLERKRKTYWQAKKQPSNVASYYRQS